MAKKILFAPKQPEVIVTMATAMTPAGYELVMADPGTPEFIQAAGDAEYYLGLARRMGGEFFRSAMVEDRRSSSARGDGPSPSMATRAATVSG